MDYLGLGSRIKLIGFGPEEFATVLNQIGTRRSDGLVGSKKLKSSFQQKSFENPPSPRALIIDDFVQEFLFSKAGHPMIRNKKRRWDSCTLGRVDTRKTYLGGIPEVDQIGPIFTDRLEDRPLISNFEAERAKEKIFVGTPIFTYFQFPMDVRLVPIFPPL